MLTAALWISTALMCIATVLSYVLPSCRKNYLPAKMICAVLFFIVGIFAALARGELTSYSIIMIIALFFGLWGDFFLEFRGAKYFYVGVASFSICHLLYIYTFVFVLSPSLSGIKAQIAIGALCLLILGLITLKVNKIKFHGTQNVMILYSLILMTSFIFACARGAVALINGERAFGLALIAAGFLFIISDSFLASQLYGKPLVKHPEAFVLFMYFPAQTLFALSIYLQ